MRIHKRRIRRSERGVALVLVLIAVTVLTAISAYALQYALNQKSSMTSTVNQRTQAYFYTYAGAVEARSRIANNRTDDIGGGDFTAAAFDPPEYFVDVDDIDGATGIGFPARRARDDVGVDIGARQADGLRRIRTRTFFEDN